MKIRYALILCAVLTTVAIPLAAAEEGLYTVRKGDTISRIARWHDVKAEALLEANDLDSDRLTPGMRLTIPPRQGESKSGVSAPPQEIRHHTVEQGETLGSIAETYGMSVKDLKKLNRVGNPRKLRAGSQILVYKPAASVREEAETATAPPATVAPESRLARELKELTNSPVVKEVRELSTPSAGGSVAGGIKEKLIGIAQTMLDIPYRFGGNSLLGIDCSGYVQKVFSLLNIMLPRTAREQFHLGKLVGKEELSIGDLVFFRTYAKFPSHVGIYLGNNQFIHASSWDRKVKVDSLDAPYFLKRFMGARRLPLEETADEI